MMPSALHALNDRPRLLHAVVDTLGVVPALWLAWRFQSGSLGFNPLETLLNDTATAAMSFLLITLAVTSVRRWLVIVCRVVGVLWGRRAADWNFLIRVRRDLGLLGFFYASLHLGFYLHFDTAWATAAIVRDIEEKLHFQLGWLAWALLVPLVLTSTQGWRKRLGRRWQQLHQIFYVVILLLLGHIWTVTKLGNESGWWYTVIATLLFADRLWVRLFAGRNRPEDTGDEAQRSPPKRH